MAVAVVERLEVIDIEQRQAQARLLARGAGQCLGQDLVEMPAVGDAGQRVGEAAGGQAGISQAQLGHGQIERAGLLFHLALQALVGLLLHGQQLVGHQRAFALQVVHARAEDEGQQQGLDRQADQLAIGGNPAHADQADQVQVEHQCAEDQQAPGQAVELEVALCAAGIEQRHDHRNQRAKGGDRHGDADHRRRPGRGQQQHIQAQGGHHPAE